MTRPICMVSLEPLLPGCGWEIAAPYHLPIEAGIRAELARLRGQRWLVARHVRTIDYDMVWPDQIRLDQAFTTEAEARAHAEDCLHETFTEARASRAGWRADRRPAAWPETLEIAGRPISRLERLCLHESWWQGWELDVAVFPIAPEAPIDPGLIRAIGYDRALIGHFRKLGEAEAS